MMPTWFKVLLVMTIASWLAVIGYGIYHWRFR